MIELIPPAATASASRADAVWMVLDAGHPLNPISTELLRQLRVALDEAERRPEGIVYIRSRSPHFSAGVDLREFRPMDETGRRAFVAAEYEEFRRIETSRKLFVAIVEGHCLGAAAELALACDFRVFHQNANFGYQELRAGYAGPARTLARYVQLSVARDLLYSGRSIDATTALALGLCDHVIDGDVTPQSIEILFAGVTQLLATNPTGVELTKQRIATAYSLGQPFP